MTRILILKTGALGDVLRTTSILPGLSQRFADLEVTWLTAHAARPLVERHELVARTIAVDPSSKAELDAVADSLASERFEWVLSLDDEMPLCELASKQNCVRLSGAHLTENGERAYTDDVAEWFEMGLLSRLGKEEADRRKVANTRSHPLIYADMFGVTMGHPELPLLDQEKEQAADFYAASKMNGLVIGLNTGAGGRWTSKTMPVMEVVRLIEYLHRGLAGRVHFLVLGGKAEAERNAEIVMRAEGLADRVHVVDGGSDNGLGQFAALIDRLDLLITSDSLAMHMAIARRRPLVAFFAPTSAAEIELYGLGESIKSTGSDYCSYRKDADNSSITAERVGMAALGVLGTAVSTGQNGPGSPGTGA